MERFSAALLGLGLLLWSTGADAQVAPGAPSFGGIGAVIGMRDAYPTVIRVLPGSPAERAGLRADDRIVRIDRHRTYGGYLPNLVARMRGTPGTRVTLMVARPKQRGGVSRARRVRIVRELVQAPPRARWRQWGP